MQWPKAKDLKERVMMLWREYGVMSGDVQVLNKSGRSHW